MYRVFATALSLSLTLLATTPGLAAIDSFQSENHREKAAIQGTPDQQPSENKTTPNNQEMPLGALRPDEIVSNGNPEVSSAELENRFSGARNIIGRNIAYTVRKGDSLRSIAARFGVNGKFLARTNGLDPRKHLMPGQLIAINTRRIIPKVINDGIVINIPDRTLYQFKGNKLDRYVLVGLGMPHGQNAPIWRTPTGSFTITSKVKDPIWYVPSSIQKKMKTSGQEVKTIVPPGKKNPLGKYALKTSLTGILIHSTILPESIYGFTSHGCIRVLPQSMEKLFTATPIHTRGEIIYQPVKLAQAEGKYIFLEVHEDIYGQAKDLEVMARNLLKKQRVEHLVDWQKMRDVLTRKPGIPVDITRSVPAEDLAATQNNQSALTSM